MTALLYLLAGVFFILGLRGLGSPRTARRGNQIAAVGMLLASVVTLVYVFDQASQSDALSALWWVIILGALIGGAIGAVLALKVQMTSMPELVAAFNGFGGGASALVAFAAIVATDTIVGAEVQYATETEVTVALSIAIGVVTLSGSFVAYGKLKGIITGQAGRSPRRSLLQLDARHPDDRGIRMGRCVQRADGLLDPCCHCGGARRDRGHPDRWRRHAGRHLPVELAVRGSRRPWRDSSSGTRD